MSTQNLFREKIRKMMYIPVNSSYTVLAVTHENLSLGFPSRSDTNRAVQPQKMARGLKFWILEVERLYYLCSENKGADQLCSNCAADLRLCFRICAGFLVMRLIYKWGLRGSLLQGPVSMMTTSGEQIPPNDSSYRRRDKVHI